MMAYKTCRLSGHGSSFWFDVKSLSCRRVVEIFHIQIHWWRVRVVPISTNCLTSVVIGQFPQRRPQVWISCKRRLCIKLAWTSWNLFSHRSVRYWGRLLIYIRIQNFTFDWRSLRPNLPDVFFDSWLSFHWIHFCQKSNSNLEALSERTTSSSRKFFTSAFSAFESSYLGRIISRKTEEDLTSETVRLPVMFVKKTPKRDQLNCRTSGKMKDTLTFSLHLIPDSKRASLVTRILLTFSVFDSFNFCNSLFCLSIWSNKELFSDSRPRKVLSTASFSTLACKNNFSHCTSNCKESSCGGNMQKLLFKIVDETFFIFV